MIHRSMRPSSPSISWRFREISCSAFPEIPKATSRIGSNPKAEIWRSAPAFFPLHTNLDFYTIYISEDEVCCLVKCMYIFFLNLICWERCIKFEGWSVNTAALCLFQNIAPSVWVVWYVNFCLNQWHEFRAGLPVWSRSEGAGGVFGN